MDTRRAFGNTGEALAARYLEDRGYRILERQWRHPIGELDLVAERDGVLVCVEVKTRKSDAFGHPEEAVDERKLQKLFSLTEAYRTLRRWHGPVRLDVIAVTFSTPPRIKHLRNVG